MCDNKLMYVILLVISDGTFACEQRGWEVEIVVDMVVKSSLFCCVFKVFFTNHEF